MIALPFILPGLLGGLAVAAPLAAPLPRSLHLSKRSPARTAKETAVWATQELDRALERYGRRTDLGKRDSGSVVSPAERLVSRCGADLLQCAELAKHMGRHLLFGQ